MVLRAVVSGDCSPPSGPGLAAPSGGVTAACSTSDRVPDGPATPHGLWEAYLSGSAAGRAAASVRRPAHRRGGPAEWPVSVESPGSPADAAGSMGGARVAGRGAAPRAGPECRLDTHCGGGPCRSDFAGVVGSDRWSAYGRFLSEQRALCYAHLKRDFQSLMDRGGEAAPIGRWGPAEIERLFALRHRFCVGAFDCPELRRRLVPLQARLGRLLRRGRENPDRKAAALYRELDKWWAALWTFAGVEGVEPTNNVSKRPLRPAVLWRKGRSDSEAGRCALRFCALWVDGGAPPRMGSGRTAIDHGPAAAAARQGGACGT